MATANIARTVGGEKFSAAFSVTDAIGALGPLLNAAELARLKIFVGAPLVKSD